ncbi:MAG: hypothetical protein IPP79_12640 [Chitinophagaceae bacterium]|nr:hypothetical protein [Chitinophagaceae bacterium]
MFPSGTRTWYRWSTYDDESAIKRQIIAITEMVNQNYQWMGIAKSPREARKLILEGKLAVVLGIETDNLGNFKTASYNWNDNVGPAINHWWL